MSVAAPIPWIQYNEDVVGESEPNGLADVSNRPAKFIVTQSDFATTDNFPGFMARYTGIASPEGVLLAPPGHAFVDTVGRALYIKMSVASLATGWTRIGGNASGNGSPEGVVSASIGQLYEQRDAAAADSPLWVKRTGTLTTTLWVKQAGYLTSTGVIVGDGITVTKGTGVVAIGAAGFSVSAAGTGTTNRIIAINTVANVASTGNGNLAGGIFIGRLTFSTSGNDSLRNIIIGDDNVLAADHAGNITVVGGLNTVGGHFTGTSNAVQVGVSCNTNASASTVQVGDSLTLQFSAFTQSGNIQIGSILTKTTDGSNNIQIGTSGTIANSGEVISIGRLHTINNNSPWSIAIGSNVTITGQQSIAIGRTAVCGQATCIAIGNGAQAGVGAGSANNVAIGTSCLANGAAASDAIAVGSNCVSSSDDSVALGVACTASATCIAVGSSNSAGSNFVVLLGRALTSGTTEQIMIGRSMTAPNTATSGIYIGNSNTITAAAGTNQIVLGNTNTTGTNTGNIIIGNNLSMVGGSGVAIGGSITVGGSAFSVAIMANVASGAGSCVNIAGTISGSNAVSIGTGSSAAATAVGIGSSGSTGGQATAAGAVAVGAFCTATAGESLALGFGAGSTHASAICLGRAQSIQTLEFVVGGANGQIATFRFNQDTKAAPTAMTWRQENASGSNIAGANWTFIASRNTGSGASGQFVFQVGAVNGVAATLGVATTTFIVDRTVAVGSAVNTNAALAVSLSATCGVIVSTGRNLFGTTTLNTVNTGGMTFQQGGADDEILSLKSTDVAHGITSLTETDTYACFKKVSPGNGGVQFEGYSAGTTSFILVATSTTADTTKANGSVGATDIFASLKSGTTRATLGANANMVTFRDNGTCRFILDADGDSHQDVGTAWTNFDTHDDVALLNKLSAHVTRRDDPLRASFGRWLNESRDDLQQLKLVTFNEDGHHFVNMSRLTMLHTGAIRQLGERFARIEKALMAANLLPAEV